MDTIVHSEMPQAHGGEPNGASGVLDEHLTERQLAAEFKKSPRTLQRWRRLGEGPAYIQLGRRVLYRRAAVIKWLEEIEHAAAEE